MTGLTFEIVSFDGPPARDRPRNGLQGYHRRGGSAWPRSFHASATTRPEPGLGQFHDGVELANPVENVAGNVCDANRLKRGTIGGAARQGQPPGVGDAPETPEKPVDVAMS